MRKAILILIPLIILVLAAREWKTNLVWGDYGTTDFVQYWSAFRVLQHGGDPYDPNSLRALQEEVGRVGYPVMMWTAPWTTILLYPILVLPFSLAVNAWLFLSAAALLLASALAVAVSSGSERTDIRCFTIGALGLLTFSFPIWNLLSNGQVTSLLLVSLAAYTLFLKNRRDFFAGLCLVPLALKAHLFLVLGIATVWWSVRARRWQILLGFLLPFVALILVTCSLFTQTFEVYPFVPRYLHGDTPGVYAWTSATVVGALRAQLYGNPTWPIVIIPLAAIALSAIFFVFRREEFDYERNVPLLLAISLSLSPYAWIFDHSLLLLCHIPLLLLVLENRVSGARKYLLATILLGVSPVCFYLLHSGLSRHEHYFWLPLLFLLLLRVFRRELSREEI
jgi:hypothetical protein